MIKLENIEKSYQSKVIFSHANFEAKKGDIVLIIGKSGSGKTTLLDIIAGIKKMDAGYYFFEGSKISPNNDKEMSRFRNESIGYILQDFALIDDYTVLENIALPAHYSSGMSKKVAKNKARELAGYFAIDSILANKVKSISGGQKQRVAIARSLLLEPKLILADEPTTNLDKENFAVVIDTFQKLQKQNKTIIIATHDERLEQIANQIYVIEKNNIVLKEN